MPRSVRAGLAGLAVVVGCSVSLAAVQGAPPDPLASLRGIWQAPPADARPMMRWWWFGPAVEAASVDRDLRAMKEAGIGGVEVQPVYPVVPDDPEHGLVNHPFLSQPFLDTLAHSAATARALGLRFDLTLGSGWPYGGPHIPITHAAGRLRWERVKVTARRVPLPAMTQGEQVIAATLPDGGAELADVRDGAVWLPEGPRPAEIWVYIAGRTGMMVKRAAVGAEGYVLDHYDRAALQAHLDAVGTPMLDALRGDVPATLFCDSLEVFGSDWTPDLLPEFQRRRGYDLRPHLASLVSGASPQDVGIRRDWGLTLGELYEERFLTPLTAWAHGRGAKLRIQGYGIPPATLASNRLADLTDGEGAAWKTITAARWASSANHLFDRPVTASETWTWLHSPAFRATPLDLKAEADRHFLQGINQFIGHGWPSTPPSVDGEGWRFYAAAALNDRNPWWIVMPSVTRYLQRVSAILRQGRPVDDVALYLPTDDALGDIKPGSAHLLDLVRQRVGTAVPGAILDAGFGFDLIDDGALAASSRVDGKELVVGAQRFRAVVLPAVRTMPAATLSTLRAFVAAGGRVIAVDRLPESTPGFRGEPLPGGLSLPPTPPAELATALGQALTPDVRFEPASPDIGQHHRRIGDADVYFLANTANSPQRSALTVRARGGAEWWDPLSGASRTAEVTAVGSETMTVALDLEAYGSTILVVAGGTPPRPVKTATSTRAASAQPAPRVVPGPWTVSFAGGAATPKQLDAPASWDADEATRFFSGVATYETAFELGAVPRAARVWLDFGPGTPVQATTLQNGMRAWMDPPVREAATVVVNGQPAGDVWCPPFRVDVTALVRPGRNALAVRVGNTNMNRMAGRPLPDYRLLVLRYGDRFQPQTMEDVRPLPSGLVGPVRIAIEPGRPERR